jgi:hypothetical protein
LPPTAIFENNMRMKNRQKKRICALSLSCFAGLVGSIITLTNIFRLNNEALSIAPEMSKSHGNVPDGKPSFNRGEKIRTFNGERLFSQSENLLIKQKQPDLKKLNSKKECHKWAIYSIPEPTLVSFQGIGPRIEEFIPSDDWCVAIVTRELMKVSSDIRQRTARLHYLSLNQMAAKESGSMGEFTKALLRSSSTDSALKNVGYFYAIREGARYIMDLEDSEDMKHRWNNLEKTYFQPSPNLEVDIPLLGDRSFLNPHTFLFNDTVLGTSWPRGYPQRHEHPHFSQPMIAISNKPVQKSRIGIVQQLSSKPDLDTQGSILMQNTPIHTKNDGGQISYKHPLLVPRHAVSPYNAKATLHTLATLWSTLLPVTLPDRVSDIWRAYMAQTLFHDLNLHTIMVPPPIMNTGQIQNETIHQSLKNEVSGAQLENDMTTDLVFYTIVPTLVKALNEHLAADSKPEFLQLPTKMEDLWIDLYERGFLDLADVQLVQLWWKALLDHTPYSFPGTSALQSSQPYITNIVLLGHFNFATHPKYATLSDTNMEHQINEAAIVQLARGSSSVSAFVNGNNETVVVSMEAITEMAAFWVQKWREFFAHVVVRGPFSPDQAQKLRAVYGIQTHGMETDWAYTVNDRGLYSPVASLVRSLEEYQSDPTVEGVLYLHDDLLLNLTDFFASTGQSSSSSYSRFPTDQIIATGQGTRESFLDPRNVVDKNLISRRSYNIYPNGTFVKPNGEITTQNQTLLMQSLEYWPWNPEHCIPRLQTLAQDPRAGQYREKSIGLFVLQHGGGMSLK